MALNRGKKPQKMEKKKRSPTCSKVFLFLFLLVIMSNLQANQVKNVLHFKNVVWLEKDESK